MSDIPAKERILQAALEEFSREGYKSASTNNIAKNSEVSKGLIFHYFGNKEKLYNACLESEYIGYIDYILLHADAPTEDYVSRIMRIISIQAEYILKTGRNTSLLMDWYQSNYHIKWDEGEQAEFLNRHKILKDYAYKIQEFVMKNIDTSMLRQDMEKEKLLEHAALMIQIYWLRFFSRYQNDLHKAMAHIGEFYDEMKLMGNLMETGINKS